LLSADLYTMQNVVNTIWNKMLVIPVNRSYGENSVFPNVSMSDMLVISSKYSILFKLPMFQALPSGCQKRLNQFGVVEFRYEAKSIAADVFVCVLEIQSHICFPSINSCSESLLHFHSLLDTKMNSCLSFPFSCFGTNS
jgi:hypothetical protein